MIEYDIVNDKEINDWLQMNFPISSGIDIHMYDDLLPSLKHYLEVQFETNSDSVSFVVYETKDDMGLRGNDDIFITSFKLPYNLINKISRIAHAQNPNIK